MQIRDFSAVPYLPFFDFGSNKRLCPLYRVSTVNKTVFDLKQDDIEIAEVKAEIIEQDDSDFFVSGSIQCAKCDEVCKKDELAAHMKFHWNLGEEFSCAKCLRKFETKSQIRNHIKWHRLEETHPNEFHRICEFCGMHFSTGNQIRKDGQSEKSINMRGHICNLLTQAAVNKSSPQYNLRLQSQRLARLDVLKNHLQDITLPYREVQYSFSC